MQRRIVLGYRRPIVVRTRRWQAAALGPWYRGPWSGRFSDVPAIAAEDVLVAHQPKWAPNSLYARADAETKANSLVNLNDPGTDDAVETATIAHGVDGWDFDGTGYLTSIVPDESYTMLVQFESDDVYAEYMCGCGSGGAGTRFYIVADNVDESGGGWGDGSGWLDNEAVRVGNLGIGDAAFLVNGEQAVTDIGTFQAAPTENVLIGTIPALVGPAIYWFTGTISAFAIVKNVSLPQVMALVAAMAIIGTD